MKELSKLKIDLHLNQQDIDVSTLSERIVFGIFSCISEQVAAGLQLAVSQRNKLGRPAKINERTKSAVRMLRGRYQTNLKTTSDWCGSCVFGFVI